MNYFKRNLYYEKVSKKGHFYTNKLFETQLLLKQKLNVKGILLRIIWVKLFCDSLKLRELSNTHRFIIRELVVELCAKDITNIK